MASKPRWLYDILIWHVQDSSECPLVRRSDYAYWGGWQLYHYEKGILGEIGGKMFFPCGSPPKVKYLRWNKL